MSPGVHGRSSDPNLDRRYRITVSLEYKLLRRKKIVCAGRGVTLYISSSEIVFKAGAPILGGLKDPIPDDLKIEASLDWPVRLDNAVALRLHVQGEIAWNEREGTAIRILQYQFRTARASQFPISGT